MNIPRLGPIADGLIYEADIPFSWRVISRMPVACEYLKFYESNRQVLQLLLKESAVHEPDAIPDPVAREMNRLDSKLDLLISLVGTLLSKEAETPEIRKVWLGSEGFQVLLDSSSDEDPLLSGLPVIPASEYVHGSTASDCLVRVDMFLDALLPQPLRFYARVEVVQKAGTGSLVAATFLNMDQDLQDLLEKFIFQQHRRNVASARTEYSEH